MLRGRFETVNMVQQDDCDPDVIQWTYGSPSDGYPEVNEPGNVHYRDDSALGESPVPDELSGSPGHLGDQDETVELGGEQQIHAQETCTLSDPRNDAEALDVDFCTLLTSVEGSNAFQMRPLLAWLPHWDCSYSNPNNVASDREATYEDITNGCGGYHSLPDEFHPFEQLPNFSQPFENYSVTVTDRQLSAAEIHAIQVVSGTWTDPIFPQFCTSESRRASFPGEHVQLNGMIVDARRLATAGFYYVCGKVQCYHCGCSVRVWKEGMSPVDEHILISPRCRAVMNI